MKKKNNLNIENGLKRSRILIKGAGSHRGLMSPTREFQTVTSLVTRQREDLEIDFTFTAKLSKRKKDFEE